MMLLLYRCNVNCILGIYYGNMVFKKINYKFILTFNWSDGILVG